MKGLNQRKNTKQLDSRGWLELRQPYRLLGLEFLPAVAEKECTEGHGGTPGLTQDKQEHSAE